MRRWSEISDKEKQQILEGRRLAKLHAEKYPKIDFQQQKKDAEEFSFLEKLRPEWPE